MLSLKRRSKSANLAGLLDTLAEKEKQKDSNPKGWFHCAKILHLLFQAYQFWMNYSVVLKEVLQEELTIIKEGNLLLDTHVVFF